MESKHPNLTWEEFTKVEMRVGTILTAVPFEKAKNPSYILTVDFGPFGIKKTSAQITVLYDSDGLIGSQVVAVVNFPPKQIANLMSECLILGAVSEDKSVTLLAPERAVANGTLIG